jgi:hypothetical protein
MRIIGRLQVGPPLGLPLRLQMPDPKFADLARFHTLEGLEVPHIARSLAGG